MNVAVLILGAALLALAYVIATRSDGVKEPFEFTAPKGTYTFGSAVPADASSLDRALGAVVDPVIPKDVLDGGGSPVSRPHDGGAETDDLAKRALAKVPKVDLDFVSTEYAGKAVDKKGNAYYDIAFMAWSKSETKMIKLALTVLVTPAGQTYVRRFSTFSPTMPAAEHATGGGLDGPTGEGGQPQPTGVADFSAKPAAFEDLLGLKYTALYS